MPSIKIQKKSGTAQSSTSSGSAIPANYQLGEPQSTRGSGSEIHRVNPTAEALANEDVLHLIFERFDLQPGSRSLVQTRKDLLSAAKTCRAFVEPALNSLWRILPSLLPLLLLLPSAEISNNHYFADNLPINNWERFKIHARRVRTLYMEIHRVVIPPTIYLRIRGLYDGHILPGLKDIYIPDNTSLDLSPLILLVLEAPLNLVELNNSSIMDRSFFMPFLTLLATKSPQLSHLALRGTGNTSLEHVYFFKNLRRLEIRLSGIYLYPQTLRRLGNLVNLLDLTLDVGTSTPAPQAVVDARLSTSSPSSYKNPGRLRRLHVIGVPSSITRVLDDIKLVSLITLVVDETNAREREHTETFWKRIFNQISVCHAIEDIEINQCPHRSWGHEHYSLSTSWLLPLLNLNSVKNLVINNSALSGSDDDFRLLACAFPKLKKLVVPHGYYSEGRTLACLFYFSQECRDLREISISLAFDVASNLDAVKKLNPHPIPVNYQHPLAKLSINSQFGQIQPTHMVPVAQFLDLIFPNLAILTTYNSASCEISTWTGIEQTRVALQADWLNPFRQTTSETDTLSTESGI